MAFRMAGHGIMSLYAALWVSLLATAAAAAAAAAAAGVDTAVAGGTYAATHTQLPPAPARRLLHHMVAERERNTGLDPFTPLALTHRWCHKLRGALSSLHTFFSHATHRHSSAATPTSAAAGIVGAKAVRGMIDAEALPPVGPGPLQGHRAATHVTLRRLLAGPVLTLGGSGVSDDDDFEPVSSGDDDGGDDDSSDSLLADNNDNEGDEAAILNEGDNEGE